MHFADVDFIGLRAIVHTPDKWGIGPAIEIHAIGHGMVGFSAPHPADDKPVRRMGHRGYVVGIDALCVACVCLCDSQNGPVLVTDAASGVVCGGNLICYATRAHLSPKIDFVLSEELGRMG